MTTGAMIELAIAAALMLASVVVYRKQATADGTYGSQGSVIILFIGIIMAIHALGWLEYHPSQAELESR
jgi:hypothetical protein